MVGYTGEMRGALAFPLNVDVLVDDLSPWQNQTRSCFQEGVRVNEAVNAVCGGWIVTIVFN